MIILRFFLVFCATALCGDVIEMKTDQYEKIVDLGEWQPELSKEIEISSSSSEKKPSAFAKVNPYNTTYDNPYVESEKEDDSVGFRISW